MSVLVASLGNIIKYVDSDRSFTKQRVLHHILFDHLMIHFSNRTYTYTLVIENIRECK